MRKRQPLTCLQRDWSRCAGTPVRPLTQRAVHVRPWSAASWTHHSSSCHTNSLTRRRKCPRQSPLHVYHYQLPTYIFLSNIIVCSGFSNHCSLNVSLILFFLVRRWRVANLFLSPFLESCKIVDNFHRTSYSERHWHSFIRRLLTVVSKIYSLMSIQTRLSVNTIFSATI